MDKVTPKLSQDGYLAKILFLKNEHPDHEIRFLVSDEIGDFRWTTQEIVQVEIRPWFETHWEIFMVEDDILEYMENAEPVELIGDALVTAVKERYAREVKFAICVFMEAR